MKKEKIPDALRIRSGDRFEYGAGKGVWEVMECLPGGVVSVMDRKRSIQGQRYQHEIRRFLTAGTYKRLAAKMKSEGK